MRHSIRVHDAQLRQKIIAGEFAVPTDAVLKDGKLCEPEGATAESASALESDFSLDFSALYPEITDDAINDDEDEPMPIKTEMIESDDGLSQIFWLKISLSILRNVESSIF